MILLRREDMQKELEYGIHSYIFPSELLLRLAACVVGLNMKRIRSDGQARSLYFLPEKCS
jgi:hypothetical protein